MEAAVVMTTVSDEAEAAALAAGLLEQRLAACVQQVPITSRYRWEGEVRADPEILLLVKAPGDRAGAVRAHLEAAHPYRVPEVLVVAAEASGPYLAWMTAETRAAG